MEKMSAASALILMATLAVAPALGAVCRHPPPSPDYSDSLYQGLWYEIGRVTETKDDYIDQPSFSVPANE